jgi:hypothetical protein
MLIELAHVPHGDGLKAFGPAVEGTEGLAGVVDPEALRMRENA